MSEGMSTTHEWYGDIPAGPLGDLMPSQYADMVRSEINPADKKLRLAVLVEAIECLQGHVRNSTGGSPQWRRRIAQDAYHWIVEATPEEHRFTLSFEDCCTGCGIDAERLRAQLKRWWWTPPEQRARMDLRWLMPTLGGPLGPTTKPSHRAGEEQRA